MASAISNLSSLKAYNDNGSGSGSGKGNARFNDEAASWDSRPFVHAASKEACKAVLARLGADPSTSTSTSTSTPSTVPGKSLKVLEIGCGTGILSFLLAPHVQSIVAVDAAEGMIEVLRQKLSAPATAAGAATPTNITPVAVLLESADDTSLPPASIDEPAGARVKFDLITSHLVLHHIPDLKPVLQTMHACLAIGGRVMLTDFASFVGPDGTVESGSRRFHPESKMEGVARHGIAAGEMEALMKDVGFENVNVAEAWRMPKLVESRTASGDGAGKEDEEMEIPFVLCYGEKP